MFNYLNETDSFGFDCRDDDECKKLTTGMDLTCIEKDATVYNDDVDLSITNFIGSGFQHRFKPLLSDNDYDIIKMNVLMCTKKKTGVSF